MRKIRLSDTDLELFDIEISPTDYTFYQRHKDAFKTMWKEQGKSFWVRFVITFRSFTVKHGVVKQMSIDSPKFQNLIDQAFIFIHEQFVDGKVNVAKNFVEDIALLAQNQDKFTGLDSKSFSKDPFYARETRELFRNFFGRPDQKTSYLKVYILFPVYLRFGGSVCRALIRWVDAEPMDPNDDSYWIPPKPQATDNHEACEHSMCCKCNIDCEAKFFCEQKDGRKNGPAYIDYWNLGDPRFVDQDNPLFAPHLNSSDDWRWNLTLDDYRDFYQYVRMKYGRPKDQCQDCADLRHSCDTILKAYKDTKKKNRKKGGDQNNDVDFNELLECNCLNMPEAAKERRATAKQHKERVATERSVFSDQARVTSDYEMALGGTGSELFSNKVAGFKVIKIEDEKNGLFEVNVSVASLKSEEEEKFHHDRMKYKMQQQLLNSYILNADVLRAKIDGLPKKLEWWEGRGFAIAVLNYEHEEKAFTKKWTNFALKISGFDEIPIKQMMIKLLHYVGKRKLRTCHGWNMVVDDIVTCMLPEDSPKVEDLSISIQRGFRFEDRLTDQERDSLLKHQPNLRLDKVLMGVEAGAVAKMLAEKSGKDKLKKMINEVADRELYGLNLPAVDKEKLRKKLNNKADITHFDVLWEQAIMNPDKIEFFVLMEKHRESELWELGLKSMDICYYMAHKHPQVAICPTCKVVGQACACQTPMVSSPEIVAFINQASHQDIKLLGEENGPPLPKMSYKEFNSFPLNESTISNCIKRKKAKKSKDKKIEIQGLPSKFKEVGIQAEKTTITIPSMADTSLLGEVPLDASEKPDKMAPIPGLSSSLNFTFQTGQKEQTITVSLGAYMPEEKLHQLAESNKLSKLCTEEEKRLQEAMGRSNKKADKKSKKRKGSAKVQETIPVKETESMLQTTREQQANLTGLLMNEFMGSLEARDVERLVNQQLGVSTKKQDLQKKDSSVWAMYEKRRKEKEAKVAPVNEKGDNIGEEFESVTSSKAKVDEVAEIVSDMKIEPTIDRRSSGEKTGSETGSDLEGVGKGSESRGDLKKCWNCSKVEPRRKVFKKCQKCKEEGVIECRYYCGRDCQVDDWKLRHKQEHKNGNLV